MDAAPHRMDGEAARGASRLLEHCATLERVTRGARPSARVRLEHELGWQLTQFLLGALCGGGRSGPLLVL